MNYYLTRGVEIRKCCACPRASYLKKITCPVLFKHLILANTVAGS